MIEYPRKAFAAVVYLFRHYNDIDVYVEDTTCRNMYEVFINRILANKCRIEHLYQIGGRENVIKACKKDQSPTGRPRLYLVDGDMDVVISHKRNTKLKYFHQLRVFCSENLVLSEKSVHDVAAFFGGKKPPFRTKTAGLSDESRPPFRRKKATP